MSLLKLYKIKKASWAQIRGFRVTVYMWTEFVTDYHISFYYTVRKFDLTLFIVIVVIFLLVNFLKTDLSFARVFFFIWQVKQFYFSCEATTTVFVESQSCKSAIWRFNGNDGNRKPGGKKQGGQRFENIRFSILYLLNELLFNQMFSSYAWK